MSDKEGEEEEEEEEEGEEEEEDGEIGGMLPRMIREGKN